VVRSAAVGDCFFPVARGRIRAVSSGSPQQTALITAAMLDSAGRFIANVGVPAAITFFLLAQITPRLDAIAANQLATTTQLAIIGASCGGRPSLASLPPSSLGEIARSWVLTSDGR
jgi:hypothetical protein